MDKVRNPVRPIVTYIAIGVFAYLAIVDMEARKAFIIAAVSIISFWFGQREG